MEGILIAVGIILLLLAIFILYDNRKKIFKKRVKKAKKADVDKKEEEKKPAQKEEKQESKISFQKREVAKQEVSAPVIEDLEINTNQTQEYSQSFSASNRMRRPMPQRQFSQPQHNFFTPRKRTIKDQIDDLSPEMKAILFSNALGKKDDQF